MKLLYIFTWRVRFWFNMIYLFITDPLKFNETVLRKNKLQSLKELV